MQALINSRGMRSSETTVFGHVCTSWASKYLFNTFSLTYIFSGEVSGYNSGFFTSCQNMFCWFYIPGQKTWKLKLTHGLILFPGLTINKWIWPPLQAFPFFKTRGSCALPGISDYFLSEVSYMPPVFSSIIQSLGHLF